MKLPTREVNDRLVDNERECPSCKGTLEGMGEHTGDTRQISVEKRRFFVDRHVRYKYRCRRNSAIQTARARCA